MEQVLDIVLWILVVAAVLWGSIVFVSIAQSLSLKQSKLKRLENDTPPESSHAWAADSGFEFAGNFRLGSVYIAGWEHKRRPGFFCEYRLQQRTFYDIATNFADEMSLTTASTKDGNLTPKPPGHYHQTFSNLSLEQLWEKHIEAENYLVEKAGVRPADVVLSFEDEITAAVQKELAYHKTIPLYHFRVPWWYFVRRNRLHNKTIRQQHEAGMITLPNEML